jgi:hypothetical protein
MTLILTALTPRHIVQVSDRRVVEGAVQFDEHVKAVVTDAFACAYTGVAELDARTGIPEFDHDTAYWLGLLLSDHVGDADRGIQAIASAAEHEMQASRYDGYTVTVVCAGWAPMEDGGYRPMATVVSAKGWDGVDGPASQGVILGIRNPPPAVLQVPQWLRAGSTAERHGGPIIVGDQAVVRALPPEERPHGSGEFGGVQMVRLPPPDRVVRVHWLDTPYGVGWGWPGAIDDVSPPTP